MSVLIDPDQYDASEQQFQASLDSPSPARQEMAAPAEREPAWYLVAAAAPAPAPREETKPVDQTPYWRNEVTSRIESYRARRKRPPRERSLSLDFERAANRAITTTESPVFASSMSPVAAESPVLGEEIAVQNASDGALEQAEGDETPILTSIQSGSAVTAGEPSGDWRPGTGDSNIIEFPRLPLVVMPPCGEELAEPVLEKPRILDAPEAVDTAQAPLGGIQLEPEEEEDAPAVQFELPLVVAGMSQRVFAGLLDLMVVALASAVFLMIVLRGGTTLPPGKAGAILLLAGPILFWAVYEYMFLVHGGGTPGMRMARLRLVSFDGGRVSRRLRRGRALAMVLSCLSLGLGLLWALLDEDTLCWHDRISRTYVVGSQ